MDNERLHYGDKIIYMEGVIVDVDDCSISIDLKGRLGFFKAPKRMFICDTEPKVGQEVGWNMSFHPGGFVESASWLLRQT